MKYSSKKFLRFTAIGAIFLHILFEPISSLAGEIPLAARIAQVIGLDTLIVRRGRDNKPAKRQTVLKRHIDTLIVPKDGNVEANLRFYGKYDQDLGLFIRAIKHNNRPTLYYFPCTLQGNYIIQWANEGKGGTRACEKGLSVEGNVRKNSQNSSLNIFQALKEILAQGKSPRFQYHCVVQAEDGRNWLDLVSKGYPCQQPLEQCFNATKTNECSPVTLDQWTTNDKELTASFVCANNQIFTVQSNGTQMKEKVEELWQQAQTTGAKFCGLSVIESDNLRIIPKNKNRLLARVIETDTSINVEIIEGEGIIRTANDTQGLTLPKGKKYIYSDDPNNTRIEDFDAEKVLNSPEIQDFIKAAEPPTIPVGNPADAQYIVANLPDGKYTFCSEAEPKEDWRVGEGICFWFRKEGSRIVGSYGYPHSDVFVHCVSGEVNKNFIQGQALEVSWPGSGYDDISIFPVEKESTWDEEGHLKIAKGKVIKSKIYEDEYGRYDWILWEVSTLDLTGFYRYSDLKIRDENIPKSCSVEDNFE